MIRAGRENVHGGALLSSGASGELLVLVGEARKPCDDLPDSWASAPKKEHPKLIILHWLLLLYADTALRVFEDVWRKTHYNSTRYLQLAARPANVRLT